MTYYAFWLAGRRHQVNWSGPGCYMLVDNGMSVALWKANWGYVVRHQTPIMYIGKPARAKAACWRRNISRWLGGKAARLRLPATTVLASVTMNDAVA